MGASCSEQDAVAPTASIRSAAIRPWQAFPAARAVKKPSPFLGPVVVGLAPALRRRSGPTARSPCRTCEAEPAQPGAKPAGRKDESRHGAGSAADGRGPGACRTHVPAGRCRHAVCRRLLWCQMVGGPSCTGRMRGRFEQGRRRADGRLERVGERGLRQRADPAACRCWRRLRRGRRGRVTAAQRFRAGGGMGWQGCATASGPVVAASPPVSHRRADRAAGHGAGAGACYVADEGGADRRRAAAGPDSNLNAVGAGRGED